jgi:hypothetical protein
LGEGERIAEGQVAKRGPVQWVVEAEGEERGVKDTRWENLVRVADRLA